MSQLEPSTPTAIEAAKNREANKPSKSEEVATVATGCFWGPDWIVRRQFGDRGLISSKVGYTGGSVENPKYRQVIFPSFVVSDVTRPSWYLYTIFFLWETLSKEYRYVRARLDTLRRCAWHTTPPRSLTPRWLSSFWELTMPPTKEARYVPLILNFYSRLSTSTRSWCHVIFSYRLS